MVSKKILEKLTLIELKNNFQRVNHDEITVDGNKVAVINTCALVVGSGAAALRASVELRKKGVETLIATAMLFSGTSACSGSDKQTIFSASTSAHGDDLLSVAKALYQGGAMPYDLAYVEAAGSYHSLETLRYLGVPFPEDDFGCILRYKTDHDEAGRATSCGPRTSRLMVQALSNEASKLGTKLIDFCTIVKLVIKENTVLGAIGISKNFISSSNPYGLVYIRAKYVVLAGGGSGELYLKSAYPYGCFGTVGLALESGINIRNIQEQQFGISTDRQHFAWNLSGTYMQAMPHIYSEDLEGNRYNFLEKYYRNIRELASNIFRKGYQWPIHVDKLFNYGSSLIDYAVYEEEKLGRKIYLDFTKNPIYKQEHFDINNLDDEVYNYLDNAEALLDTPIKRLEKMNPLSIMLYKTNGYDITKERLEVSINQQHFNGGVCIDIWARTNVNNCFAIGETAGTHGVTRPGGSALNAGQVFAKRCAQYISRQEVHCKEFNLALNEIDLDSLKSMLVTIKENTLKAKVGVEEFKVQLQNIMSSYVGFVCDLEKLQEGLSKLLLLEKELNEYGLVLDNKDIWKLFVWKQLVLEAKAIFFSIIKYLDDNGISRGARIFITNKADNLAAKVDFNEGSFYVRQGEDTQKNSYIEVSYKNGNLVLESIALLPMSTYDNFFFEKDWSKFLELEYEN